MMTNLFSIFDPSINLMNLSLNWLSNFLMIMFMPYLYWMIPSRYNFAWSWVNIKLHCEFKIMNNYKGSSLMFTTLFLIIFFNNFLGLFPYIFTSTSHLVTTLSMALPIWIMLMMYGWMMNTQHMFIHMIPEGTPSMLMSFMVCIESISNLIRPGTLSIRLSANMIAGHLLMTLLSNSMILMSNYVLILLIFTQIMLLLLECSVAIIQSYVFTILSTLYSKEVI